MYSLTIEDSDGNVAEHFSFDHGAYVIGRQEDCDIVLPSSSVSRRHAELFVEDGRCFIEDLNSANGVTVDGQKVVKQRHLGTASQVRIGDYYLYLEYQDRDQMADQDVRSTLFISDDTQHFKLVRINDEFAGEEFALSEMDNTIGRTDDNFILLSDQSISRSHATIERRGDEYILRDLDSSNGTRVNDDRISGPTPLQSGDTVKFGSVQFVFVPGGEQVDPEEYRSSTSRRYLIGAGMLSLVLVGLVLGGLVALTIYSFQPGANTSSAEATPPASGKSNEGTKLEQRISPLLEEGRRYLDNSRWEQAASRFEEILKIAPDHSEAKKLRDRARTERQAADTLEKALNFSEQGQWRQARETIAEISEETEAYERSRSVLRDVEQNLAHQLRLDARRLMESESPDKLSRAHDKLVEALSLVPDSTSLEKRLDALEQRLDNHGVDYTSYRESAE